MHSMAWYFYPLLVMVGFIAGFVNTLAGSGSILTLPLLMYLGLPATVANATNRIGIIFQNATGTATFHQTGFLDVKRAIILGIPAIVGSILGALIAVSINADLMKTIIGVVMVFMAILLLLNSNQWLKERIDSSVEKTRWWHLILMFLIGVYGGFIQLGVGIFLLFLLVIGIGLDIKHANALKVAVTLLFNMAALIIFQGKNQINWIMGLIVAFGSILGAWVGARYAIHWKVKWIYWLLIVVVLITAMDLLGVVSWLGTLLRGG